jgi:hypothetical protein
MIPTEAGNKSTRDPNFLKNIEGFIKDMRQREHIFLGNGCRRTGYSLLKCQV